jgi:hypothetical protein
MSEQQKPYSTEKLKREITDEGGVPMECCFVFRGSLSSWNPTEEGFTLYFIENDDLYLQCISFLQRNTDRCFSAFEELREYAHAHAWPNLAAFDSELAAWRSRVER